ncbi:hypothetical protein OSG_eHP14_00130 [environmental Halophage eHP-14]|nr:hypothetical protein OSG_eHP14_00130 [environmental Halophage eHP-14]
MVHNMSEDKAQRAIIPRQTAHTALQELEIAIERTGGDDADNACSPLALARQKIEDDDQLDDESKERAIDALHEVADERGVEITDADPLTDGTFRARTELKKALEGVGVTYVVGEECSADEEDVRQEELHDVAHGMMMTAFIFDSDERGLTGFKVPSGSIEWVDFTKQGA